MLRVLRASILRLMLPFSTRVVPRDGVLSDGNGGIEIELAGGARSLRQLTSRSRRFRKLGAHAPSGSAYANCVETSP